MNDILVELLSADGYIIFNKSLARMVGREGALLIGELVSKFRYYRNKNMLTKDEFFYATIEDIEDNTTLNAYEQRKVIKQLVTMNLLTVERRKDGLRFFKINFQQLQELFSETKNFGSLDSKVPEIKSLKVNNNNNSNKIVEVVVNSTEADDNLANTTNQMNSKSKDLEKLKQTFIEIAGKDLADELENTRVSSYKNHLEDLSIEELNKLELLSAIGRDIGYPDYRLLQNHFSLTNLVTKRTPEECRKLVKQKEKELKKKQLTYSITPKITRDMLSNETF